MKVHELEITYNQRDKLGIHDMSNCKYVASLNSKIDCYNHLVWFLTKSEVSQHSYIEVLSVEVNPL